MTVRARNRSEVQHSLRLDQSLSDPQSTIEKSNMSEPHPCQQLTRMITGYWVAQAIYAAVFMSALARIAAALEPQWGAILLPLAGAAWVAAFALFGLAYAPLLAGPRLRST